ncbi:hypothetical protein [Paraburkholderia sp. MM6662-R1]|uniref:hypothetical protein n=1 Tax=Paraburkholderia sp. MM6662-R1 TaxID=2991066 RepID=UPI003D240269
MIGSSLELGAVVATYPEGQSVDVLLRDGSRLANVQVMVWTGSDKTGTVDLPDIGGPIDDSRWSLSAPMERYVRGIVASLQGVPVCIGFLLPQVTQVTFKRKNFRVKRHASDVYSTIDGAGNMEVYHPSGTYWRVGTSPAHEVLDGQDFDKRWKISNNTGAAPHVHLTVANAGSPVASIDIDPGGNIAVQANGNLSANVGGNLAATVGGTTSVNSSGDMTLTAPNITMNAAVLINGSLAQGTGASGGTATMQGPVTVVNDLTAAGTSVHGHKHGGVQKGGDETDPPV